MATSNTARAAKTARKTTLSLTIEFESKDGNGKVEVHTLNPGTSDRIERFGGSSYPLFANKTASIVTRNISAMGVRDFEQDIYAPEFWEWIARMVNGEIKAKMKATATPKE